VAVFMADASDRSEDLVRFWRTMQEQDVDCVFGTRFHRDARIVDYPKFKLVVNRMANAFIQAVMGLRYNDVTNAFKLYRREVIEGGQPYLSHHFNLTVEVPLKAIVRGYSYAIVPNWWINRKTASPSSRSRRWALDTCSSSCTASSRSGCRAATTTASSRTGTPPPAARRTSVWRSPPPRPGTSAPPTERARSNSMRM
jgi:hypothetical protein